MKNYFYKNYSLSDINYMLIILFTNIIKNAYKEITALLIKVHQKCTNISIFFKSVIHFFMK